MESNTVEGDGTFESEGGGLFIRGDGTSFYGFLDAIAGGPTTEAPISYDF